MIKTPIECLSDATLISVENLDNNHFPNITPMDAIEAIEAYHNQFEKWISVEDRLPTKQGHYIVMTLNSFPKNCRSVIAEFYEDNQMFYSESSEYAIEDALYWCELPPNPTT